MRLSARAAGAGSGARRRTPGSPRGAPASRAPLLGVEIAAGLVVALSPRFGGLFVAGWLAGIIVSLLLVGGYADIALRDFGLLVGCPRPLPPGECSRGASLSEHRPGAGYFTPTS